MGCDLCNLAERDGSDTRLYYQNSVIKIVDCNRCLIPMVVFKRHGDAATREKRLAMTVINELFEYENIRNERRRIPDHEHWHIEGAKWK